MCPLLCNSNTFCITFKDRTKELCIHSLQYLIRTPKHYSTKYLLATNFAHSPWKFSFFFSKELFDLLQVSPILLFKFFDGGLQLLLLLSINSQHNLHRALQLSDTRHMQSKKTLHILSTAKITSSADKQKCHEQLT